MRRWLGALIAVGVAALTAFPLLQTAPFPGDQKVTSAWSATVSQNGSSVTAANVSYDGAIAPGASVSFGFQGTWGSNDTAPGSFTPNGVACA